MAQGVREAREVAARWVVGQAAGTPGFAGAYFSGSSIWLPDDAELPVGSDVDVMVVTDGVEAPPKLGKFRHEGVLIEVTYLSWEQIRSAEHILASYHLAGSFRTDTLIADPTGRLTELQKATARDYAKLPWVRRRCLDAERRIVAGIGSLDPSAAPYEQVTGWLFPAGVTTHVLLSAGLRNPTVRLRYLAVRELLVEYGMPEVQEELLGLLGCANLTRAEVERWLGAMTEVFDATVPLVRTPFFFASDITAEARPIAVDGSRHLVERGRHREAVFWIVATYARCLKILAHDASPATYARFVPAFEELTAGLGLTDLQRRAQEVMDFLPRLGEITEAILARNSGIDRGRSADDG